MAEVYSQPRRGGVPGWLPWLVVGLIVLALGWVLAKTVLDRDRASTRPAATTSGAAANVPQAGPITSLERLATSNDPALIGRPVALSNVRVQRVTGDKAFWIGAPGAANQVLVILDEQPGAPPAGVEGRYDVNAGQTISITAGYVRRFPSIAEARQRWGLDTADPALRDLQFYVHADRLAM